jgi:hypothetical protein
MSALAPVATQHGSRLSVTWLSLLSLQQRCGARVRDDILTIVFAGWTTAFPNYLQRTG